MRFLLRLLINAAALWVATRIVPGVTHSGSGGSLLLVALVFGLLNAPVPGNDATVCVPRMVSWCAISP